MMMGRLYGVGLGPGDPELLTVKAVRVIETTPVIAYFAQAGRRGQCARHRRPLDTIQRRGNAAALSGDDEIPVTHPDYNRQLAPFMRRRRTPSRQARFGRDVAILSEGDPLFYGSSCISTSG